MNILTTKELIEASNQVHLRACNIFYSSQLSFKDISTEVAFLVSDKIHRVVDQHLLFNKLA